MAGVKGKSGRKPMPSTLVNRALAKVDKRLPDIFEALITRALEGDREAQIYLIDRRLGKPKQTTDMNLDGDVSIGLMIEILKSIHTQIEPVEVPRLNQYEEVREIKGKDETN
tara:strand:+ start:2349 stop:2684 length:336 start_codon:yes stop_codon:yes gene_type:complete